MQRKQKRIISAKEAESFIQFRKYLEHQTDRSQALYNMATYLLSKDTLTDRQLSFKNNFFATFARELAGPCGCSEVVPDHLRINNPSKTQFLIELMLALYKKTCWATYPSHNLHGYWSTPSIRTIRKTVWSTA